MNGPIKFWHVYCYHVCFSLKFLNMCKPRATIYLSWLGMLNASWLDSMRSETFLQIQFPQNKLPFYLGRPIHVISSLFSHFCLFQNAILHKMLKIGFWIFISIFLKMQFSLVAISSSLVLVVCLTWYLHFKLSHELLTFISFNILK